MKNNEVPVSVIMSVYNDDKYISEAIESILDQTFNNFEFIIVNDGSVDNSLSIIKSYMLRDKRIKLISRENKGLPYSLNEGINLARGKYIARMDSDDIAMPERLEKQFYFMEKNKEVGVLGSNAFQIDQSGKELNFFLFKKKFFLSSSDKDMKLNLVFTSCFVHPTVFIRKNILENLCFFYNIEAKSAQDYDLWCRLASKTKFHNMKECLLKYRVNPEGVTHSSDGKVKTYVIQKALHNYLSDFDDFNSDIHIAFSRPDESKVKLFSFYEFKEYERKLIIYARKKWGKMYTLQNSRQIFFLYNEFKDRDKRVFFEKSKLLIIFFSILFFSPARHFLNNRLFKRY